MYHREGQQRGGKSAWAVTFWAKVKRSTAGVSSVMKTGKPAIPPPGRVTISWSFARKWAHAALPKGIVMWREKRFNQHTADILNKLYISVYFMLISKVLKIYHNAVGCGLRLLCCKLYYVFCIVNSYVRSTATTHQSRTPATPKILWRAKEWETGN